MGRVKARQVVWTRSSLGAVSLIWVLVISGAQCGFLQPQPHAGHLKHPLAMSLGGEFAINVNHAHLSDNSKFECPDQFVTAVPPRSTTPSIVSVVVLAVASIAAALTNLVVPGGRGPPVALACVRTGQDLLTRFCLARR
ncbi:hypothetical protein [Mycobacterium haemophilum]|uniref:hypothetical protein n=1 Tax=Mycobacterium haemophilum TaxID=29311 RepID=UPI0006D5C7C7|nr:hypothetical protein [Mycobacterium haemophilum]MCV7339873.1 hypothetical protein [Mycobacterium haemophilum DSM 44634]